MPEAVAEDILKYGQPHGVQNLEEFCFMFQDEAGVTAWATANLTVAKD